MNLPNVKLSTSNPKKIEEFQEFLGDSLTIVKGADIDEVNGTVDEVIMYKALDSGKDIIVEDTILKINGVEVVDIRWKVDEFNEGDKAEWITSLGYNNGESIIIFRGSTHGTLTKKKGNEGFAFDPFFVPDESEMSLSELDHIGEKGNFSARFKALSNFVEGNYLEIHKISEIPVWNGTYQH